MPQNVCLASCCAHSISSCKSLLPWWWVKTFLASLSGVEWSSLPAILFLVVSAERKYTSWNRLRGVLEVPRRRDMHARQKQVGELGIGDQLGPDVGK